MNKTTNERFTKRTATVSESQSRSSSRSSSLNSSMEDSQSSQHHSALGGAYDEGGPCCLVNCKEMCCN